MDYKITEISEMLGTSKVTIHKKIKDEKYNNHKTKVNNSIYIDKEGLELLKQDLTLINKNINKKNNDFFEFLKSQNEYLKEQLKTKDEQLSNKDKLLENMQVLIKQSQDKVLMLEESKKFSLWQKIKESFIKQ